MSEKYEGSDSINHPDQAQLNYSPDTSILLNLGMEDRADSVPKNDVQSAPPIRIITPKSSQQQEIHSTFEIGPKFEVPLNLNPEDTWNTGLFQSNLRYATMDPNNHVNIVQLNDQILQQPNIFLGQNYTPMSVNPQIDTFNTNMEPNYPLTSLSFISSPTFFPPCGGNGSGMEECVPAGHMGQISMVPMNYNINTYPLGATPIPQQRSNPDVGSNIYVTKGSAKLSEAEDWTPNPNRLLDILSELEQLNEVIGKLKDECDLPNAKPNLKRERNRLASKACRLKKKATHETNKIKLEGLEIEFKLLVYALHYMSWEMISYVSFPRTSNDNLTSKLKDIQKKYLSGIKVAGDSDSFVKSVLDRTRESENRSFNLHNPILQI